MPYMCQTVHSTPFFYKTVEIKDFAFTWAAILDEWGVWKSGKPESGIGTGMGTGTGTGTGIGTRMARETYIKAGTTFTLI